MAKHSLRITYVPAAPKIGGREYDIIRASGQETKVHLWFMEENMWPRILKGVWLDGSKAVIVTLLGEETEIRLIDSGIESRERIDGEGKTFGRFGNQFMDNRKSRENKLREQENQYVSGVFNAVREADQLLIMGPAHLKNELEKSIVNATGQKPNIRAVETADSMTENQIAARVKEFFGKSTATAPF